MKQPDLKIQEFTAEQLQSCFARIEPIVDPADFAILKALHDAYLVVLQALSAARVSVARLKRLFLGPQSEKSRDILKKPSESGAKKGDSGPSSPPRGEGDGKQDRGKSKPRGHGRNGTEAYTGAARIRVPLAGMHPGCACRDEYCTGKVYRCKKPLTIPRIIGQPALMARIWELERWRCNLCGKIYAPEAPQEARGPKYDETAVAMLALLHFGNGLPFHRLDQFQRLLGIPLPASTQSELLTKGYEMLLRVFEALQWHAAQCKILHTDDTGMIVLDLLAEIEQAKERAGDSKKKVRTGIYTTGVVAVAAAYQICLYFTGRKHAGENLSKLLEKREDGLPQPIHVSDGLERNKPGKTPVDESKCLTHGRRQFVDILESFPKEGQYVVELLREVYRVDELARQRGLSDGDRLLLHQEKSGPVMEKLRRWMEDKLLNRGVEPNSSLGKAIVYMLNKWTRLTKFLHGPGVPLDNNVVERALKKAIRHRNNSLFYKTENGAAVGDLFMSLIETCTVAGVNPFHYLTTLLKNIDRVQMSAREWMPWNYHAKLGAAPAPTDGASERDGRRDARPPSTLLRPPPPIAGASHASAPVP